MIDYSSAGNKYANSTTLNNTYAQCVDNDMFILKKLRLANDSSRLAGPVIATDDAQVKALPDGAKFFGSQFSSTIMQKRVKSISETVKQANGMDGIQSICAVGQYAALLCMNNSTFMTFVDKINDTGDNLTIDANEIRDDYTPAHSIAVTASMNDSVYVDQVFGCRVGSSRGLYLLNMPDQHSVDGCKFMLLARVDVSKDIRFMSYDQESNSLVFATESAVYLSKIGNGSIYGIKMLQAFGEASGTGNITAIQAEHDKVIVFTSASKIYTVTYDAHNLGFANANEQVISTSNTTINCVVSTNGYSYAATSKGLYLINSTGKLETICDYASPVHNAIVDSTDGSVWCGDEDGRILHAIGRNVQQHTQLDDKIFNIQSINGVKIISTGSGIKYQKSSYTFEDLDNADLLSSQMIVASSSNVSASLYIAGNDSSQKAKIQNLSVYISKGDSDFNSIDGVALQKDFGNNSKIVGFAILNGKSYAFSNIYDNASTFTQSQMFDIASNRAYDDYQRKSYHQGEIKGIIRKSDDVLYVTTTKKFIRYVRTLDGQLTSTSYDINSFFANNTIIDSQMIDDENVALTLSSASTCYLAKAKLLQNGKIDVEQQIDIGNTGSNICKYKNMLLVMQKTGNNSALQSYEQRKTMSMIDIGDNFEDPYKKQTLSGIYGSRTCYLVNNFYTQVSGTHIYRKSDYLLPYYSSDSTINISAVQSFMSVDLDEGEFLARNVLVEDLGIHGISNIRYSKDGNFVMCYVKSGNTIKYAYVDNDKSLNTIRSIYPSEIFSDSSTSVHIASYGNVTDAVIENAESADNTLTWSSLEICNNKLQRRTQTYVIGNDPDNTAIDITGIKANFSPVMLCRSKETTYVAARNSTAPLSTELYKVLHNANAATYIKTFDDSTYGSFQSMAMNYKSNDSNPYVDEPDTIRMPSFDEYDVGFETDAQNDNFIYVDPQICYDSVDDDALYMLFNKRLTSDESDTTTTVDGSRSYVKVVSVDVSTYDDNVVEWPMISNMNVMLLEPLGQVADNRCNQAFIKNLLENQNGYDVMNFISVANPVTQSFCKIDDTNSLCIAAFPSEFADTCWIGKDQDIGFSFAVNSSNQLSVFDNNGLSCKLSEIPNLSASEDIHLARMYDSNSPSALIYTIPNSEHNIRHLYACSSGANTHVIAESTSKVRVLNDDAAYKFPKISYSSGKLGTVEYAQINIANTERKGEASIDGFSISQMKAFALDANDNISAYAAFSNDSFNQVNAYAIKLNSNDVTSLTTFANVDDIAYPDNMYGMRDAKYALLKGRESISALDMTTKQLSSVDSNSSIDQLVKDSNIGVLSYSNGKYSLFGNTNIKTYRLDFDGYSRVPTAIEKHSTNSPSGPALTSEVAKDIVKIDDDCYAVQTAHSIYQYSSAPDDEKLISNPLFSYDGTIGSLQKMQLNDASMYIAGIGNSILSASYPSQFNYSSYVVSSLDNSFQQNDDISKFIMLSPNVMLAVKYNTLYYSQYEYEAFKNTSDFSDESAYYTYYDNIGRIYSINDNGIYNHIEESHAPESLVTQMNSYMDTSFQLSGFIDKDSQFDVSNDYLEHIFTGTASDGIVLAFSANTAGSKTWKQIDCSYVAKYWKSGLTELYIYLPTTFTYYIPHIEGASQCNSSGIQVDANNRMVDAVVDGNETSVRINIESTFFTIGSIFENTIKGNSLPLQIYRDTEYADECAGDMFHSFICPSIAANVDFSDITSENDDNSSIGYYTFNYYCFGSDAQAIKLSFFNPNPRYDKKYKTIVYNVNTGNIPGMPGMKQLKQRIYEGEAAQPLYWDIFQKEGSFFAGWSSNKNALDGDDAYYDGLSFTYDLMRSSKINLYAIWISYKFGPNDSQMTISNTQPMDYTIAEITIDPSLSQSGNPSLGNTLVVDYGD